MTDSNTDGSAGSLRFRQSNRQHSKTSGQPDVMTLVSRWMDAGTLPELCALLHRDLCQHSGVSQLLIVSHSNDVAQMWAVAPADDDLVRAVDRLLGTSPNRMDLLTTGRGRVLTADHPDTQGLGPFAALGFTQTATVSTDTPISFAIYCGINDADRPSHPDCLTEALLWPGIQMVLRNLARLEHLRALSHIDSVSGIHNRSYLNMRLVEEVARARRFHRPLSLAIFDIDHFKSLNDTYGHQTGDAILRQMAEYVRWTIRSIDVFCRLGGDEFAVLMPDADTSDCSHFAERLLSMLTAQRFTLDESGQQAQLSISMGAAVFPVHATEHERLIWCADMSLLEAKHRGRGRFLLYERSFGRQTASSS